LKIIVMHLISRIFGAHIMKIMNKPNHSIKRDA
jgi:hypothetical protein